MCDAIIIVIMMTDKSLQVLMGVIIKSIIKIFILLNTSGNTDF